MAEPEEEKLTKKEKPTPIVIGKNGVVLATLEDMWRIANLAKAAGISKPDEPVEQLVMKMELGMELGITIMQSLQNIFVVNFRPSLWGDIIPGLVETSGLQEYGYSKRLGERNPDGTYPDLYGYRYTTKRKGRDEYTYDFIVADAKQANLWKKAGTWTFYPDRMLLNRARTFCLRDVYPDVLKGLQSTEEARDIQDAEFVDLTAKPKYEIEIPEKIPADAKPVIDDHDNQHWNGKVYGPQGYYLHDEPAQDDKPEKRKYTKRDKVVDAPAEMKETQGVKPEAIPELDLDEPFNQPDERGRIKQGKFIYDGNCNPIGTIEEVMAADKASKDFKLPL